MTNQRTNPTTDFQHPDQAAEIAYLSNTNLLLQNNLTKELDKLAKYKENLREAQKELQENLASLNDSDKQIDASQYLNLYRSQENSYQTTLRNIKQYQRMENSPYFGRIDFTENGYPKESIYIGRGSLRNPDNYNIQVYDWRAPIASIFYRFGFGQASYQAPTNEIAGEVTLKRQYEISEGQLKFFFDTELNINDEILIKELSNNASPKMKDIVETIQKEQDVIIRDVESELLMVQGVAGSGKTSVALHRVAYLMYQSLVNPLVAHNIVIISPNTLFSQYISHVLPDLGEENIASLTFDSIFANNLTQEQSIQSRAQQSEALLTNLNQKAVALERDIINFKASSTFCILLDRLAWHYEHQIYNFPDFYYNGRYIASRQELKEELLRDRHKIPFTKRLEQIKIRLLEKIHKAKKARLPSIIEFVSDFPDRQLEIKPFARLLSMKHSKHLLHKIEQLNMINFTSIYSMLFLDQDLFYRLAKGLTLPDNIAAILQACINQWDPYKLSYSDAAGLTYLKIKLDGAVAYTDIKQVVVDEFQDYGSLHFALLKHWFPKARYTILGDINQSVDLPTKLSLFEEIKHILNLNKSTLSVLQQSFRNSYEISKFSQQFLEEPQSIQPFNRHEVQPELHCLTSTQKLDEALINNIHKCREANFSSIAVICKTMAQAQELHQRLRNQSAIRLINENSNTLSSGTMLLPVYLAKGLEFDAVLLYDTSLQNYSTIDDKRLLYIATTRALHHLSLYYTGELSNLIKQYV